MPKIKKVREAEEELEDEEEDEEEQFEDDELENNPTPLEKKTTHKKVVKAPAEVEPKRRFGVIAPQPIRIVDTESEEVIGEGEYLIATTLTDILERLERIENNIGSMLEG